MLSVPRGSEYYTCDARNQQELLAVQKFVKKTLAAVNE
jgi:hypothetical protein